MSINPTREHDPEWRDYSAFPYVPSPLEIIAKNIANNFRKPVVVKPEDTDRYISGYSYRYVRNLGWLLRRTYGEDTIPLVVFRIYEYEPLNREPKYAQADVVLTALFEDGVAYASDFASRKVLRNFLDRPALASTPIDWRTDQPYIDPRTGKVLV